MALQGQFLHSNCIYLLMHGNTSNRLETEINILYVYGRIKDMLEKWGGIPGTLVPDRGQWRPFLCRVSFPVWLACLAEALARLFLQFPFSPFFFFTS